MPETRTEAETVEVGAPSQAVAPEDCAPLASGHAACTQNCDECLPTWGPRMASARAEA